MADDSNNDMTAQVSAVMVSYHTGPVLRDAIGRLLGEAALRQLIVVDNGNPAADEAYLGDLAANDGRVTLIRGQGNVGYAAACNMGAALAAGQLLLFINPDCVLDEGGLARLLADSAALEPPWLLGCLVVDPKGREQRACRRNLLTPETMLVEGLRTDVWASENFADRRLNLIDQPLPDEVSEIPAVSGALFLIPHAEFQRLGGFDEAYRLHVEDLDLFWRFHQMGGRVWFTPHVRAVHEKGSSRANPAWIEKQKMDGFRRYFRLHFPDDMGIVLNSAIYGRYLLRRTLSLVRRPR